MAVYARGYRPYEGSGRGAPAWWVICQEGYRLAFRGWGFRLIGVMFLVWFVIWAALLYFVFGASDQIDQGGRMRRGGILMTDAEQLMETLSGFYGGVGVLIGLLAILVGAGLVSDDLRSRALPLYLVRPMRSWQYALGKALVLPRILVWTCLLPGALFYGLVGLWQPPGESWTWLQENVAILESVGMHYLIASLSYTGLMLIISSRTDRRGAVIAIAATVLFAGTLLSTLLARIEGIGHVMKHAGIPLNSVGGIMRNAVRATMKLNPRRGPEDMERVLSFIPEPGPSLTIGIVLMVVGLGFTLRRASTVEVSA